MSTPRVSCSDKRGGGGQRLISGSLLLHLTARPPSGYSRPCATVRLAYSYLITPHTLEMHTSGVLSSISRDERDDAAGEVIAEWLTSAEQQGKHVLPANLVNQVGRLCTEEATQPQPQHWFAIVVYCSADR